MNKLLATILSILIIVAVGVFAWWAVAPFVHEGASENTFPTQQEDEDDAICIQVITPARNPETGDIVEFPTPCDVPEDWEVIQNEVPSLDLI